MTTLGSLRAANELAAGLLSKARAGDSAVEAQAARSLAVGSALPAPFEGALQTAERLKILLGTAGRVVAVTGLGESDGFTALAATLGFALAALDESRVLVMDANVREPRLHELLCVPKRPGILDLLEQKSDLEPATTKLELNNLFFLPVGQASTSLAALLSQPGGVRVLDEIRRTYRYVIIDAGVIRSGPGGMLVASMSDGVVAALAIGARRRDEVLQFRQELKQLNIPLFGVVLTQAR